MQHAAIRLRIPAARENRVLRLCEEATRARQPTWIPAYALDAIYGKRLDVFTQDYEER